MTLPAAPTPRWGGDLSDLATAVVAVITCPVCDRREVYALSRAVDALGYTEREALIGRALTMAGWRLARMQRGAAWICPEPAISHGYQTRYVEAEDVRAEVVEGA